MCGSQTLTVSGAVTWVVCSSNGQVHLK
jgi:hypothetical protein